MQTKEPNPEVVRAAMLPVVDNQLRDGKPPETSQTLERRMAEGHSETEARQLIAAVVSSEIYAVLKHNRPYDEAKYVAALQRLPKVR